MTTLICILVGLGAVLTMVAILAVLAGTVVGVGWLWDRWEKPAWEIPPIVGKVLGGMVLFLLAVIVCWGIYDMGCDIAFDNGWIDDCPTCEVTE